MAICMDCIKYLGYKLSLGQSPSVPSAQTGSKPKHEYVFPSFLPTSCNYQTKTLVPWSGKGGGICRSYAKVSMSIASSEFCCALISWDEALANFRLSRLSLLKEIAGIFPARQFGINLFFLPQRQWIFARHWSFEYLWWTPLCWVHKYRAFHQLDTKPLFNLYPFVAQRE